MADAVSGFLSLSNEFIGCAILGPDQVIAASGDRGEWDERARALLEAADRAAGAQATQAHVATEEGEVYAVRMGDMSMVAVTSRFTLASLVFADMRAALREARAAQSGVVREAA